MSVKVLEWDREGTQAFEVEFADNLPVGITLSTPVVTLEQQTATYPDVVWTDRTSEVTISNVQVVVGETAALTKVQFRMEIDAGPEPEPADNYRVVITADRSDGTDEVSKNPMRIRP
jgi:hypothetical protein